MKYSEDISGITLDVQAAEYQIEDAVKERIRKLVNRLSRRFQGITYVHVFLENKASKSTRQKQVSVRLGIPGNDPFASEYGDNFMALLSSVEEKLRRQLERRQNNT